MLGMHCHGWNRAALALTPAAVAARAADPAAAPPRSLSCSAPDLPVGGGDSVSPASAPPRLPGGPGGTGQSGSSAATPFREQWRTTQSCSCSARASSARAPLRMLTIAWLPSWQAYSQSCPAVTPREA